MPPDPPRGLCLQCSKLASPCAGYGPAFGSNNFSLKAKHHWNTRKLCILTDAFKGGPYLLVDLALWPLYWMTYQGQKSYFSLALN